MIDRKFVKPLMAQEIAPDGTDACDNFIKWFGESQVHEGAAPLIVFHGAPDVRGIFERGFEHRPGGRMAFLATSSASCENTYADAHRSGYYQEAEEPPTWAAVNVS